MTYGALHQTIDISLDMESTKTLSPLLFGDNLEHTRDCINSGLSAQMLKNRKFVGRPDRYGCAVGWHRIGEEVNYTLSYDRPFTKHHESYHMSRLLERQSQVISAYRPGTVGFGQAGLCLRKGRNYSFKMTATAFGSTEVNIGLTGSRGTALAGTDLTVRDGDFRSYEWTFSPAEDDDDARLEITFSAPGTLIVGAVSLMPEDNFRGMRKDVIEKMKELGIRLPEGKAISFGQSLFWAPLDLPELRGLKVLRPGLELGVVKKDRFEPAHALALWLTDCENVESFAPDSKEIAAYMRGNVIPSQKKGWCLVTAGGYSLGWGKGDGQVLKNHYPKGLRIMG